jgi:DNA repair exonuclease SbcCD ATPase subunit
MQVHENNLSILVEHEKKMVSEVVEKAKTLIIADQTSLESAVSFVTNFIKPRKKKAEEFFDKIVGPAFRAWKATMAARDEVLGPYEEARKIIDTKITAYRAAERRKAEEEARKRLAEEIKEAEKRTSAALKKINRLMEKAAGLQGQVVELQEIISSPESTEEEVTAARAALTGLQAKQEATAAKIEERVAEVEESRFEPAPIMTVEAPKAQGMSAFRKKKGVVVNAMALIKAIAAGTVPVALVKAWDQKKMDDLLNMGVDLPGVTADEKDVVRI